MRIASFLSAFVLLLGLDQATKIGIESTLRLGESWPIVPGVFHITYHTNYGAAFGMAHEYTWFLTLFSFVFIVVLVWWVKPYLTQPSPPRVLVLSLMMILAGAAGNFIDRLRLGYVIDFLDFRIWPIFNVADSCITIGVALYFIQVFYSKNQTR